LDQTDVEFSLTVGVEVIPVRNNYIGTWSRMQLYSPEMEKYRPFLYIDLDTAVIDSVEYFFDLVTDPTKFITLEDFWQKGQLATGLVWFPANSEKIKQVWNNWHPNKMVGKRMDYFLKKHISADLYWQSMTNGIKDFKPRTRELLMSLPNDTKIVCFHGKPRIFAASRIGWINEYINSVPL
jgi:hypothetical protein